MRTSSKLGAHLRSNIVGYVALAVALSGTAYAGARIGSGDIRNNAVKSKHVDNDGLKAKDVKDGSLTADDIDESTLSGDPDAYANVNANTNVASGSSRNISSAQVTKREIAMAPQNGQYCIETDAAGIKSAVVTAETELTGQSDRIASVTTSLGAVGGCPAETVAVVVTYDTGSSAAVDHDFTIWLSD